jgi:hypothetical protein
LQSHVHESIRDDVAQVCDRLGASIEKKEEAVRSDVDELIQNILTES